VTGPVEQLPPDAPATIEDVRASRRWTWVALAWAVAASAIAAIALVSANNNSNDNPPAQSSQDVTQELQSFEKQVNDRLDAFGRRLNGTASDSDVQKLDKRLTQVEDDASNAKDAETKQSDAITQLQSDMKDLQQRVDQLEKNQQGQQSPSTTP
jgi:Skp family chaperone for outer membrane proteins